MDLQNQNLNPKLDNDLVTNIVSWILLAVYAGLLILNAPNSYGGGGFGGFNYVAVLFIGGVGLLMFFLFIKSKYRYLYLAILISIGFLTSLYDST